MIVELEIYKHLKEGRAVDEVAQHISMLIQDVGASGSQKKQAADFFFHSGNYKLLIQLFIAEIFQPRSKIWPHILELLVLKKIRFGTTIRKAFLTGMKEQESEKWASICKSAHIQFPSLARVAQELDEEYKRRPQERYEELFEKLDFARAEGLIQEENNTIFAIQTEYPDDARVKEYQKVFNERWSAHVIEQAETTHSRFSKELNFDVPFSDQELRWLDILCGEIKKNPSQKRKRELMFMLISMEAYDHALDILEQLEGDTKNIWHRLDLFIKSKKHVLALDLVIQMEKNLTPDVDTAYSLNFYRALALWGIQKKFDAIKILENIVKYRPNFRSAQNLLNDWMGAV